MSKEHILSFSGEDDFLVFDDEKPSDIRDKHQWSLLVVDDDESIHTSTKFVLADFKFEECELDLLHAYNSDEAKELLLNNDNIAVIILDVVMETEEAGLKLVDYVRNEMGNKDVRIILRTGQPGWAQTKIFLSGLFPVGDDFLLMHLERNSGPTMRTIEGAGVFGAVPENCNLKDIPEEAAISLQNALSSHNKQIRSKDITLYLETTNKRKLLIYYKLSRKLTEGETRLIDVFVSNASVALENIDLFENVQSLAYEDQLTGLKNRSAFVDLLRSTLRKIKPGDEYTILDIDFDHFDDINDLIGQRHGDKVLQSFAQHVRAIAGKSLTVCRISGDEFGLMYKTKGKRATNFDPYKMLQKLHFKMNVNAYDISLRSSLGIAKFSDKGQTAEAILRNAWLALRHAKENGRDHFAYYSNDMDSDVVKRAELTSDLRRAMEHDEFTLFYQPQYDLSEEKICGVEALLRWKKPNGKFTPPADFIPAMERSGLIVDVGEWVLRQACVDAQKWIGTPLENIAVSVNVSVVQLYKSNFVSKVENILSDTKLDPKRLKFEITESIIMHDADDAAKILGQLQDLGVSIAIDDFGKGYSSLSYLQRLPVDYVKIDQSFVDQIVHNAGDAVIVDVIITLGHSFGLKVVAEGVENLEQAKFLSVLGCDQIQGYYYGKPMPVESLYDFPLDKVI